MDGIDPVNPVIPSNNSGLDYGMDGIAPVNPVIPSNNSGLDYGMDGIDPVNPVIPSKQYWTGLQDGRDMGRVLTGLQDGRDCSCKSCYPVQQRSLRL